MLFKNVKIYRTALGITQDEAQKILGYKSKTSYVNKENGHSDFSIPEGLLLAKFFSLTLSELFEEECSLNIEISGKKINRRDKDEKLRAAQE